MGISCGATLIKYLLFFFNLIWLALGGTILYFGFRITSFSGNVDELIKVNMKAGAIVVLVAGFVIFLIAFLGCCGAIKENSCMLSTYGLIILILVIAQCVGAYFAFKYRTDVKDLVKDEVQKAVKKYSKEEPMRKLMQDLQYQFECCGAKGPDDYNIQELIPFKYPASCCGQSSYEKNSSQTCSPNPTQLKDVKFQSGCVDVIEDKLTSALGGLGGVAIALVLIQLLIIVSACCLAREVRS